MQVPATERRTARFGPFVVDFIARELRNNGDRIPVQDKPLQILAILLEKPGELVTREELRQRLWPADTFVDFEHSINTAVKKLREALGESGDRCRFIETLPRRGYRFIAPIKESGDELSAKQPVLIFPTHSRPSDAEADPGPSASRKAFRPHVLVMASAAALVLIVAAASPWHSRKQAQVLPATTSIAVLPFADLSPGHDQEYLSEGLAEEILNDLAKIPNLKVAARTSAFQFKGKNEDSRLLAQKLNVAHFLEGSLRRDGNRVGITVQLIKADDGFHLWSETYDRELKDILAVEDEIARAVTSALQPKLLAGKIANGPVRIRSTNPEAYEALLQARHFFYMQDEESGAKALDYATRAIRFDPDYAPAYALRAAIHLTVRRNELEESLGCSRKSSKRYRKGRCAGSESRRWVPCSEYDPGPERVEMPRGRDPAEESTRACTRGSRQPWPQRVARHVSGPPRGSGQPLEAGTLARSPSGSGIPISRSEFARPGPLRGSSRGPGKSLRPESEPDVHDS
jgi:TolB-like protein/DNA-binding winged helix-turn-helix (wHTH) protein